MAETESIQKWIGRNRPPRVHITYDVETYGAIRLKELPFVVGILADLSGTGDRSTKLKDRKFIQIDRDNFDDVLAKSLPSLKLQVKNHLAAAGDEKPATLEVGFRCFDDFKPDRVIRTLQGDLKKDPNATGKLKELCDLYAGRQLLVDLLAKVDGNDALAAELAELAKQKDALKALPLVSDEPKPDGAPPDPPAASEANKPVLALVDKAEVRLAREDAQKARAYNMVVQLVQQLSQGRLDEKELAKNPSGALQACIAKVDDLLTAQCNEVLHHPDFQRLEATWRGLHYLVKKTETGPLLKLKVLNVSKDELLDDFERASDKDQSALFKKIYEEEYGTFGGHPFSCLVGDYYFGRGIRDVTLLEKLSKVAASAHAPFLAGADPRLFDMDSFTQLGEPRDLSKIFESTEMVPWNSYRDTEDSRYVALALPRFLLRLPYHHEDAPVESFRFDENVDGRTHEKYLWGNAAWALAERITHAFALYRWCAAIRGFEGGGVVEGLPVHTFKADSGDTVMKCPTEAAITDRREKELDNLGFITLCHCKGTDYAVFFGGQMTQRPKTGYDIPDANANARISAMLPYILAASRFAHYLKAIVRDKVGSFYTAGTLSEYLNRWIGNYILGRDDAGQDLKAQYPLREARVDVADVPGKPGAFKAVAFLRPHFQLEELTTSIRLVASLPPPAA